MISSDLLMVMVKWNVIWTAAERDKSDYKDQNKDSRVLLFCWHFNCNTFWWIYGKHADFINRNLTPTTIKNFYTVWAMTMSLFIFYNWNGTFLTTTQVHKITSRHNKYAFRLHRDRHHNIYRRYWKISNSETFFARRWTILY